MNDKFPTKKKQIKVAKQSGIIGTFINRKISICITKYLAQTNLTPNQITFFSFLIIIPASFLFATGQHIYLIIGGVLVQVSYTFDLVDGEIARLKNMESKYGAWLDGVLDRFGEGLLFLGLAAGLYAQTQNSTAWMYGFLALLSAFMKLSLLERFEIVFGNTMRQHMGSLIMKMSKFTKLQPQFISLKSDLVMFLITLGSIFNKILLIFWLFIILHITICVLALFYILKKKNIDR